MEAIKLTAADLDLLKKSDEAVAKAQAERLNAIAKIIANCPYQIGDKVIVNSHGKEMLLYVSKIMVERYLSGYAFEFTKPKKDGTISQTGSGIFCNQPIRKAE